MPMYAAKSSGPKRPLSRTFVAMKNSPAAISESTSEAREKLENREAYAFCPHCSAKMENGEPPRVKES